ncbi:MAG: hypothetical protein K8F91_01865 [Candidatus Obscuribacterales bacterium]|nr:hypothetical protein [Candidatus Obscuribacterales bacterium]
MVDVFRKNRIQLAMGFSESLKACRSYLAEQHFEVTQLGSQQLIGVREEDRARVILNLEGISADQTDIAVSHFA